MASRRAQNATDESAASLTFSAIEDARATFRYLDSAELEGVSGAEVLRCSLSTRSVVSTTSSFAERFSEAASRPHLQVIRNIGEGLQGTIFEQIGQSLVLKKERALNASKPCNLRIEFQQHQKAYSAFQQYHSHPLLKCDVNIPAPRRFIASDDNDAWDVLLPKLPSDCQSKTDIVEMERVLPLPKILRRALIEELYPFPIDTSEQDKRRVTRETLDFVSNKDCLIRPYLGIPRKHYTQQTFTLRNLILGFDDLRRFETDFVAIAQNLGSAYAILHWVAHINGDDIEFVLGSCVSNLPDRGPRYHSRKIGLYLIDFGQCDTVDMNGSAQEVYQAFRGAMVTGDNACFIPNPRHSPEVFQVFKDAYSTTAKQVLTEGTLEEGKFDIDEFMGLYEEYVEDLL